ncbi:unnamed protein product [Ectocarpus sp. 6 AP-2014]
MSTTLTVIDDHFRSRMVRTDTLGVAQARPVNPFATRSSHTSSSLNTERSLAPEFSSLAKVGAVYEQPGLFGTIEKVVDTREDDHILFDTRNLTHPSSGKRKHTTDKLPTTGTRVK